MRILHLGGLILCMVLLGGILLPRARADQWNEKTIVTFNTPFEIPGYHGAKVLPAGTYVFKLLDSASDRNIVQIFNQDQSHVFATILAIPDYRMKPAGQTVLKFQERVTGSPEALRAWFYPGDLYGQEFVYPKTRAMELAKANHEPVLSMPDETAANFSKPVKTGKEPAAEALEKAPIHAEKPNGEEVQPAQVISTQPTKSGA